MKMDDVDKLQDLFPLIGGILKRQAKRIQALKSLQGERSVTDELTQLRKLEVKQKLSALIRPEDWK